MHEWEKAFQSLEDRLSSIENHLNIVPTVTISSGEQVPIQSYFNRSQVSPPTFQKHTILENHSVPAPQNIPGSAAASSPSIPTKPSAAKNNNDNNTAPTSMLGLSSDFNSMKGDVESLKDMMASLGNMLQNLGAQQQNNTSQ